MKVLKKATSSGGMIKRPRRFWVAPFASFLCCMLAWPASGAYDIPHDPLTTAARVAPNVLFILDDSGSMNFIAMPRSVKDARDSTNYGSGTQSGLQVNPRDRSYLHNTLYYDPRVTYLPWMSADGTRMTGGTDITSVFTHWSQLTGDADLVGSNDSVFFVPKAGVTSSTDPDDFVRYEVRSIGGAARVVRTGEQGVIHSQSWNASVSNGDWWRQTVEVPAGVTTLRIRTSGGTGNNGNAELFIRRGQQPSRDCLPFVGCWFNADARSEGSGNSEAIDRSNPNTGTWHVGVYNAGNGMLNNLSVTIELLANFNQATPTGRTQEAEVANIATWYSYHRSRMKAAKAGASDAFAPLDSRVRVGFRTIHGRSGSSTSQNWPTHNKPIPVNYNDGRFVDSDECSNCDNKSKWYARLHAASASGATPLLTALGNAGSYFSSSSADGPYGPQSGAGQYSCRQNFSILTTDGYWNSDSTSVGNADGTDGALITGSNNQSYQYIANATVNSRFRDSYSNTLADVAMHYWKNDLRSGNSALQNNVPTTAANPAFWQHMVTFGISIGLSGAKNWSSVSDIPTNPNWAKPVADQQSTIDDLLHAAANSRGQFVAASNPAEFTAGLSEALAAIIQRTSSFSNVATNSVSLNSSTQVFNASYVSGIWTGQVTARPVAGSTAAGWTSTIPSFNQRASKVFTMTDRGRGASFPTAEQVSVLARGGGPANYEVSGADNANYIKGERRLEEQNGGRLRNRTSLLGDIVGSSPAYVADTKTLYVGANDGMLHAFDGTTGVELFAYVPRNIDMESLGTLSRSDYEHRFFVDGPIAVSSRSLTEEANILVGTLGKGGKGLFALDVTNPSSFGAGDVMWELPETDGHNMGLVMGKPVLGRVKVGLASKNAAIISNGINSASHRAVLIIVDLDSGEVIHEIDTLAGSAAVPNGLSASTAVFGPDGRSIAYVYAGDMLGNVWKFDLTSESTTSWSAKRIFTAVDGDNVRQPITAAVAVATNPRTFERWVFFGTGRYLLTEDADASNSSQQSMYGFAEPSGSTVVARSQLVEREIVEITSELRGFQSNEPVPADKKGWYIDLPGHGERIVQDAQVASGYLVTASMMPTGDACEADGTGFINALDAFTGTSSGTSYFDLDGDGSTNDEAIGNVPVGSYNPGIGMPTLSNLLRGRLVTGGSGGGDVEEIFTIRPRWDRVSWREIRGE